MCGGSPVSLLSRYHRCQLHRMLLSGEFWYTPLMCTPLYGAYCCMHTASSGTWHFAFGTDRKLYYNNIKPEVIIINYGKISFSFLCKSCSSEQRMDSLHKKLPMKTKEHGTSGSKCAGPLAIWSCICFALFLTADFYFLFFFILICKGMQKLPWNTFLGRSKLKTSVYQLFFRNILG